MESVSHIYIYIIIHIANSSMIWAPPILYSNNTIWVYCSTWNICPIYLHRTQEVCLVCRLPFYSYYTVKVIFLDFKYL